MRALLMVFICSVTLAAQQASAPLVTNQDLLAGLPSDGSKWLIYHGNYFGHRYSPLTQITPQNVNQLKAQWTFQTTLTPSFQTTPLFVDNVLYVTGVSGNAWAIDARSGRQIWRYRRTMPADFQGGTQNRGFAAHGDKLFLGTGDAHLLALDMKTGDVIWDVELADYKKRYSATVAPLVVKDKVIIGPAGAEYGIRGFIDAFDVNTGKKAWRFYTVAGPGEPGGQTWPVPAGEPGAIDLPDSPAVREGAAAEERRPRGVPAVADLDQPAPAGGAGVADADRHYRRRRSQATVARRASTEGRQPPGPPRGSGPVRQFPNRL